LLCNIIINVMIGYYSGLDGKGDIPAWAIALTAFLYPLYHIFDILDGKHARKTGQSSPLGLLMDHGCDALTTFLFMISLGSILRLEGAFWYCFLWLMASIPFMTCTWEEYHTNKLDLPPISGVGEGCFLAAAVILFTAFIGQDFWLTRVELFGEIYQLSNLLVVTFFCSSVFFGVTSFIKVYKDENTKSYFEALANTVVFIYLVFSMLIFVFYSNCSFVEK
jgi:ethanolaminephosphotransferase